MVAKIRVRTANLRKSLRRLLRNKKRLALAAALLVSIVIGAALFTSISFNHESASSSGSVSSSTSAQKTATATNAGSAVRTASYTLDGPLTSQWILIQAARPVQSVVASNTGEIPAYSSLASLNQTLIGYRCVRESADGACASSQYLTQTGWFWDQASGVLTIHYLGGRGVVVTVVEQP
jgi:hypothetical protein